VGKCWTKKRETGVCELYGWHIPLDAVSYHSGRNSGWGLMCHPAESLNTGAYVVQRSHDTSHGGNHKDYSMTGVFMRRHLPAAKRDGSHPPSLGDDAAPLIIPFRQAGRFTAGRPEGKPIWIVIHTAECAEVDTAAENLQAYAATTAPASWHYAVDCDSVTQSVHENHTAWAAPGANFLGIQIELAGTALQTAAQWDDDYSRKTLELAARLVAEVSLRWAIPLERVGPAELQRGIPGVCGHIDATKAFKKSSHVDPGKWFPWEKLLRRASHHQDRLVLARQV
jgi:hypothetical protein